MPTEGGEISSSNVVEEIFLKLREGVVLPLMKEFNSVELASA